MLVSSRVKLEGIYGGNKTRRQRKLNEKNRFSVVMRLFLLLYSIYDV